MAKWTFTHRRQIITFCLLLLLVAFVGHFLVDATGFSLDSVVTVDLHGNFLLNFIAKPVIPQTVVSIPISPLALFQYGTIPPTPPPPIPSLT